MNYIVMLSLLCLLGLGCATSYQKSGLTGGFSETRLAENIWTVNFSGNGYTTNERANDFNLLRCAEICLENGFRYFIITDSKEYTTNSSYTTPTRAYTTGQATISGNHIQGSAVTSTYGGQTYQFSKPNATTVIVCYNIIPEINTLIFDAEFIWVSISEKYKIQSKQNIFPEKAI